MALLKCSSILPLLSTCVAILLVILATGVTDINGFKCSAGVTSKRAYRDGWHYEIRFKLIGARVRDEDTCLNPFKDCNDSDPYYWIKIGSSGRQGGTSTEKEGNHYPKWNKVRL